MATQVQRWSAAAFMAAAAMLVGACGGGDDDGGSADATVTSGASGSEAPAGGSIEVTGKEFSFTPNTLTLKAGEPQKIVLKNTGSIEHDITVSDAGFKLTVLAGKSGDKTLTIDKPGTYKMICSVAGHEPAGMKGEITVS
jgi:uncharacterized cupredoxin-like copper-binding protein